MSPVAGVVEVPAGGVPDPVSGVVVVSEVTGDVSEAGLSPTCWTKGSFVAKSENEISLPCVGSPGVVDEAPESTGAVGVAVGVPVAGVVAPAVVSTGTAAGVEPADISLGTWITAITTSTAPMTPSMIFCLRALAAAGSIFWVFAIRESLLLRPSRWRTE